MEHFGRESAQDLTYILISIKVISYLFDISTQVFYSPLFYVFSYYSSSILEWKNI